MQENKSINLQGLGRTFRGMQERLIYALRGRGIDRVIIWGAGKNGRLIASLLIDTGIVVDSFIDKKCGGQCAGIKILPENTPLDAGSTVLIAVNEPKTAISHVRKICGEQGVSCIHVLDIHNADHARHCTSEISLNDFDRIHKGQRCFIAGNGPSLNKIDMSRLKGEIVFGCNKCYHGFERWGVTFPYWAGVDGRIVSWPSEDLCRLDNIMKFVPYELKNVFENNGKVCPVNLLELPQNNDRPPPFSVFPYWIFPGTTITFVLLQLAVIMGCSPIYLIGVDFSYTFSGSVYDEQHNLMRQIEAGDDYFDSQCTPVGYFREKFFPEKQLQAFRSAKLASDLYGFKIYNATSFSKLDVFEKVDYNSLF